MRCAYDNPDTAREASQNSQAESDRAKVSDDRREDTRSDRSRSAFFRAGDTRGRL